MKCYVDIQFLRDDDNNIIVKELGICFEGISKPLHYILQAPCTYYSLSLKTRISNAWVTNHLHNIHWSYGDTPYELLGITLNLINATEIYVKGLEKKNFVQQYVGDNCKVYDLDYFPPISQMYESNNTHMQQCPLNHNVRYCAYHNCQIIREFDFKINFQNDLIEHCIIIG